MGNGAPFEPYAPRIFADDPDAVRAGTITLRGSAAHRISRVLRLRRGDPLEVIDEAADRLYTGAVRRVGADAVEAEIVAQRPLALESAPHVALCPALIRAGRFDWMVEKVTELGVHTIAPAQAARSLAAKVGRERAGRWRRLVTEASEQCRRERRPQVLHPAPALERIAEAAEAGTLRLMASARERERRVGDLIGPAPAWERVEILVGPEGGLAPAEVAAAAAYGWAAVTLGPRPLRAETASVVAVALVQEALAQAR